MTLATATLPVSITVHDRDNQWIHRDLDYPYIDGCAADFALLLHQGATAETAYQPGDGTFYGLVIAPLAAVIHTRPRIKDGSAWERHAIRGMKYERGNVLVSRVDGYSHPFQLAPSLPADYVNDKLRIGSRTSGVSVALLLRAIGHYLINGVPPRPEELEHA